MQFLVSGEEASSLKTTLVGVGLKKIYPAALVTFKPEDLPKEWNATKVLNCETDHWLLFLWEDNGRTALQALMRDASAVVSISSTEEEFERALEALLDGVPFFSGQLLREIAKEKGVETVGRTREDIYLTEREQAVLKLAKSGFSNKEIAAELVMSPFTVRTHLQSIYGKLGVHSRSKLVYTADQLGL